MKRKIISALLALICCLSLAVSASAAGKNLYDDADLLTEQEEAALEKKLETVSGEYEVQIVIAAIESSGGWDMDYLVDSIYDSMDFGCGPGRDGVLLLICMDVREYRIISNGYAGAAIDSGDIDAICDEIVSDLSEGNYAAAFDKFADECAFYLDSYGSGYESNYGSGYESDYGNGYGYSVPFNAGEQLMISLVIGAVAGLVTVLVLKGQLKTVRRQYQAGDYVRSGSMRLTVSNDIFLYRNVTRTRRQTNNSHGPHGGGHHGGGRSRGGGSF